MLKASTLALVLLLMSLWMQSCAPPPAPISSACAWERIIAPSDTTFAVRWTRAEKEQVAAHNCTVAKLCGGDVAHLCPDGSR